MLKKFRGAADNARRDYWNKHRGVGTRPIVDMAVHGLVSEPVAALLKLLATAAALAPFVVYLFFPMRLPTLFAASGIILDVLGVILLFKEWLLQHFDNEERAAREIDRKVRLKTGEEPFDARFVQRHGAAILSKHLADGVRDRLNAHVITALGGVVCLCVGFIYQLAGIILSGP